MQGVSHYEPGGLSTRDILDVIHALVRLWVVSSTFSLYCYCTLSLVLFYSAPSSRRSISSRPLFSLLSPLSLFSPLSPLSSHLSFLLISHVHSSLVLSSSRSLVLSSSLFSCSIIFPASSPLSSYILSSTTQRIDSDSLRQAPPPADGLTDAGLPMPGWACVYLPVSSSLFISHPLPFDCSPALSLSPVHSVVRLATDVPPFLHLWHAGQAMVSP